MYLLADFTAAELTGDARNNLLQGIALADEAIDFIGTPQWPLEEYLLIKANATKLNALMRLGNWEASYEASDSLISAIKGDLFQYDEFRLAFAYRKGGEVLGPLLTDSEIRRVLIEGGCAKSSLEPVLDKPIQRIDKRTLPSFE
ncbi:hypothetical protein EH31_05605 [Erythrobacter longus]|uniref:Uncharacterized protein n=1 Tax=Erythrobacter longus TaxID=1044 RepID=A0A074MJX7_ERYLO|nr:hypothetical protein [Erythrobacter longus]KEO92143.1 hypothetical protein EH31_05605 [Erythrobacter longus]